MLTAPAHPFLFDEMDELAHHRRRYRRAELGDKLRAAGFEVRRLAHFMAPLVPLVAVRWLVRAVSRPPQSATRAEAGWSFGVDAGPERADARRCSASSGRSCAPACLPFGSSLIAVAARRRPEGGVRSPR